MRVRYGFVSNSSASSFLAILKYSKYGLEIFTCFALIGYIFRSSIQLTYYRVKEWIVSHLKSKSIAKTIESK